MTSLNPATSRQYPLSVVLTSSGMDAATPGERFELGVTVHNIGDRSAIVYVFIEERTPVLQQWCHSMQERLALAPDQSGEVLFQIDIPPAALPEILEYDLVVDGSDSYQDFPPRRYDRYQLQVLPAARTAGGTEDPTFHLEPPSSSRQPLVIQPGVSQPLQVWVDNRAERVDRFRLNCIGLPPEWKIDITYPRDVEGFGLLVEADSLGLNPGEKGQIIAVITPPPTVLAGIYVPTFRLISENQPQMNLLDLVYFQINPTYQLQPLLQPLRTQIRNQPALYEVQLENLGNTPRTVQLFVDNLDDPDSCTYTLEAEQVEIEPLQSRRVLLEGVPQKWWQRPFYGAGRFFNFRLRLEDPERHPIALTTLPSNLLWLPRPWWQLLIVLLTVLGALGVLIWLIWWLFFKPPVLPQVITFEVADSRYAAANNEFARLNWEIDNAHRVQELTITGVSPDGEIISSPLTFALDRGQLPQALQPFCTQRSRLLICTNVRTNASRPGTYTFELTVTPRGRQPRRPIAAQSSTAVIEPAPVLLPEIAEFLPSQLTYQEPNPAAATADTPPAETGNGNVIDAEGIRLNWLINNPAAIAALRLTARTADDQPLGEVWFEFEPGERGELVLPEPLAATCQVNEAVLLCRGFPTQIFQVGTYTFELTAVPRLPPDVEPPEPIVATTDPVSIQPLAPAIAQFQINGQPVRPKYLIPVSPGQAPPTITLAWQVIGGSTTTVELLPVPGPVPPAGATQIPLAPMGSTLITLQATNQAGESVSRSVQIETFDPNPEDPAAAAAAAAAAAVSAAASEEASGGSMAGSGAAGGEDAADPTRIAPRDTPPQFD